MSRTSWSKKITFFLYKAQALLFLSKDFVQAICFIFLYYKEYTLLVLFTFLPHAQFYENPCLTTYSVTGQGTLGITCKHYLRIAIAFNTVLFFYLLFFASLINFTIQIFRTFSHIYSIWSLMKC